MVSEKCKGQSLRDRFTGIVLARGILVLRLPVRASTIPRAVSLSFHLFSLAFWRPRFDYQPLFREMSPRSPPKSLSLGRNAESRGNRGYWHPRYSHLAAIVSRVVFSTEKRKRETACSLRIVQCFWKSSKIVEKLLMRKAPPRCVDNEINYVSWKRLKRTKEKSTGEKDCRSEKEYQQPVYRPFDTLILPLH